MRKTLEILDFEDKKTQAGKAYARFKTNEGWMSCFDSKSNEALKKLTGAQASCEVIESGEFKNIKKFYAIGDEDKAEVEVEQPRAEASRNGKKEMYVSYAKDAFCHIISRISQAKFDDMPEEDVLKLMDLSIKAVKKAESAF